MAAMMKDYGWKVPEAQRANLIMVEENMTALENGVQARAGGRLGEGWGELPFDSVSRTRSLT